MRISDWSSDVCSSDLPAPDDAEARVLKRIAALVEERRKLERDLAEAKKALALGGGGQAADTAGPEQIGNVSFLGQVIEGLDPKQLRGLIDENKKKLGSGVSALVAEDDGSAYMGVGVTEDGIPVQR